MQHRLVFFHSDSFISSSSIYCMQWCLLSMAVKFTPFVVSKRIPRWVLSIKSFSSVSSAVDTQNYSETCQKAPNRTEIDPKVQYLKNRLCPDELIQVLDRTHDLKSALKLFKWASLQKQFSHTASTYSSIILKLGLAGNVDEMEGFCKEMLRDRCPGSEKALDVIVDVFVKNGKLCEAMRVLLAMNGSGCKSDIGTWNVLLGALVGAKREFRDVLLVYKEMVKSRILPSVDTLNYLIKALFDAGMVSNALDQFRKMRRKGCVPNCRTFEIVIHGLVAADRVDESLGVMNEMFENGVDLDESFCNHVIPLLCGENKLEEAMRLFEMMRVSQFKPNYCVYESLVKCLCANRHLSEATQLFCEFMNGGFSPSTDMLVDIIDAYCKLGDLDEAGNLLDNNKIIDPSPYNALLQGYCDAHNFLAAKDLLRRMLAWNVADTLSWTILIRGLCNINNVEHAYELLGKMIVLSFWPDCATYSALVIGNCNLCKYENAMKLFQQVRGKDLILDPNSCTKLIEGLCNLGRFRDATEIFMYISTKNAKLPCSLFSSLIKGLCAKGGVDEAIELFKFGHQFENPVSVSTYAAVMHGLFKVNRLQDTLVFYSQILRRGLVFDAETYCILIQCMSSLCQTNGCIFIFKQMIREGFFPDSETLSHLLSHLARHSQLYAVWTVIHKLHQEDEVLDPAICNLLINGLWKEGYKSEASWLLDTMLEKGWVPDAHTHGVLIGREEEQTFKHANVVMTDEVSSILSEGLGET